MRIRCSTRSRIHKFWAREELNLRRSRTPEPEESPLRLGANRPTPSLIDYPAGCRVRRPVAGFVLRVEASRSRVPLHVQALAFKSTSGDNSITDRARSTGSALVADSKATGAALPYWQVPSFTLGVVQIATSVPNQWSMLEFL